MTGKVQIDAGRHLLPCRHLYTSSPMAKAILREFFDLPESQIIPLSISHGVDFNHEKYPQDVLNAEPIHWCYNKGIEQRARTIKKTVKIPHPWLLLQKSKGDPNVADNGRTLVIGPPPSLTNDRNLLHSLEVANICPDAILIKVRGDQSAQKSSDFWEGCGVKAVSARGRDKWHHHRLMEILLQFEYIVSPVLSSVTIFASALGCKIKMLRDYEHCSYAPAALDFYSVSSSQVVRKLISSYIAHGTDSIAMQNSRELLGQDLFNDALIGIDDLKYLFDTVSQRIYVPAAGDNKCYALTLATIARFSGRSSFLKYGLKKGLGYKFFGTRSDIVCKRINLVDAATDRLSDKNFSVRPLRPDERNVRSGQGADW